MSLPCFEGVKWLFFDIGDTVRDERPSYYYRAGETVKKIRANHPESDITVEKFWEHMMRGLQHSSFYYEEILAEENAPDGWVDYDETYRRREQLFPGAKETLEALSKRYKLGIIADQPKECPMYLEEMGVYKYFSAAVISDRVGLWKPDPAMFRLALEIVGTEGVKPEECVMIGDRIDRDTLPAKSVGMKSIRVMQGFCTKQVPHGPEDTPDAVVDGIADLLKIL